MIFYKIIKILTLAASYDWDISWPWPDVKHDWSLNPGDEEMCTLACYLIFDASKSIKNNCSVTTINYKTNGKNIIYNVKLNNVQLSWI